MRVLDNRYCQFLLTCIYFIIKKKKIIILQATQYFKSPSSRYGNFNFKLYLDSSLPKKEQNIFIDEKITRSRNHYAEHIGSCFEPKLVTRARMKRRNFLRKKKKKGRQKKGWKRVVCATVCGFIQWLETRRQKSQKIWFFLSRGAQHVTVFLIKEQRVWAEWSGDWPWYNGGPLEKRVNNIVIERKHFNFWSFRWNVEEERVRERASEEEMKRGEEEYPWGYYAR